MNDIRDYLVNEENLTIEQVKLALSQWIVEPIMHNGVKIGETMMQNNEIHFALGKDYRLVIGRKKLIDEVINALLEKHGFLVTKLHKNDKLKRLIELFGFKKTHEDEQYEYFWLDKETKHDRHSNTKD